MMFLSAVTWLLLMIVFAMFVLGIFIVMTVYSEQNSLIKQTKARNATHGIILLISAMIGALSLYLTATWA